MKLNEQTLKKKSGKISAQLLKILIPMIALFIIAVAVIIFIVARSVIISSEKASLSQESQANANDIGKTMENIKGYYNGLADSIESANYQEDSEIMSSLYAGMKEYPDVVSDVYAAFSDKSFFDGGDWIPDADYDPTTRGWYQNGSASATIVLGAPSLDLTTGKMVVCGSRSLTMKNGKQGVLSTDIVLAGVSEEVAAYTPRKTGLSLLLSGSSIVASPTEGYTGTDVTEHSDDAFLQAIYAQANSGKNEVVTLSGNDGKKYMVSFNSVPGTDWILVSYVKEDDALAALNTLGVVTAILIIIILIISTLIIMGLIKVKITKPVAKLTYSISRIASGDFTVEIEKGANNEIGIMGSQMGDYVERMRGTLAEMKQISKKLTDEAGTSRNAAEVMSSQADKQSLSMEQIHETMEGVSHSVAELAINATDLAQAVSEMNEQGNTTQEVMRELLEKARQGQKDMEVVQSNMQSITGSMSEMNNVVSSVEEAAQKINTIVEMINSIADQTNLLSLNASIEAARAGEAGRGFAVVASEIGNLANDSSNATTEISSIIEDISNQIRILSQKTETSVQDIERSSDAVSLTGETFSQIFEVLDRTGSTVGEMVAQMSKVSDIATSVAAIAEEQSASTQEVTSTVEGATASAQNVAEESRNVDNSAVSVADSSTQIEDFVNTFTIETPSVL